MRKYSYESILRAVGQVLDQAEAHHFVIRDSTDGLLVEATDGQSAQPLVLQLDLPDLAQLLDWAERSAERPHYERASSSDEGTLRHFMERHQRELVGAR